MPQKKPLYIARWIDTVEVNGSQVRVYEKPKKYLFNYQQRGINTGNFLTPDDYYGENQFSKYRAMISVAYTGLFKRGDLAYFDGATPDGEVRNGQNANYVIDNVGLSNTRIVLYFNKVED